MALKHEQQLNQIIVVDDDLTPIEGEIYVLIAWNCIKDDSWKQSAPSQIQLRGDR